MVQVHIRNVAGGGGPNLGVGSGVVRAHSRRGGDATCHDGGQQGSNWERGVGCGLQLYQHDVGGAHGRTRTGLRGRHWRARVPSFEGYERPIWPLHLPPSGGPRGAMTAAAGQSDATQCSGDIVVVRIRTRTSPRGVEPGPWAVWVGWWLSVQ